jgi:hypothetical protein
MLDQQFQACVLGVHFVARLLAIVNLVMVCLGASQLMLVCHHSSVVLKHVEDPRVSLLILYPLWGANAALLCAWLSVAPSAFGSLTLASASTVGPNIAEMVISLYGSLPLILRLAPSENDKLIMSLTVADIFGNSGIAPQQSIFYPLSALAVLVVLFQRQAFFFAVGGTPLTH